MKVGGKLARTLTKNRYIPLVAIKMLLSKNCDFSLYVPFSKELQNIKGRIFPVGSTKRRLSYSEIILRFLNYHLRFKFYVFPKHGKNACKFPKSNEDISRYSQMFVYKKSCTVQYK